MAADTKPATDKNIVQCDLHNPTRARRILFDGIPGSQKQIFVARGETKRGVTISRAVFEELRDRNRAKKDSELQPKPMSDEPVVEKPKIEEPTAH